MRVLILGARAPVCLEWARAFHAAGWQVTAADSLRWPLTRFSNAVDRYIRLPEPKTSFPLWNYELLREVTDTGVDLVLPTCEEAFYLSHIKSRFPASCKVFTGDFELMERLHHKGRFAQMTHGWPISSPETHLLESEGDVLKFHGNPEEWVFKPAYSRFAVYTLIKPARDDLSSLIPTIQRPWVAQRFVDGRESCCFAVFDQGRLLAHSCYQPKYRVGRGAGIWFKPMAIPVVADFLLQFGKDTGYTGQAGFDFIEDADGKLHVIECNPRGTSGLHLLSLPIKSNTSHWSGTFTLDDRIKMVGLAMAVFMAPGNCLSREFWRDVLSAKDVIFRMNDPLPQFGQIPALIEMIARSRMRKITLLDATTKDIEWDGSLW